MESKKLSLLVAVWALGALVLGSNSVDCDNAGQNDGGGLFEELNRQASDLLKIFSLTGGAKTDGLDPLEYFLLDVVPKFFNQRPNNENGTEPQFKDYIMNDDSNDDAWRLTGVSSSHNALPICKLLKPAEK